VFRHKAELKRALATIPALQLCLKEAMTVLHAGGGKRFLNKGTRGQDVDHAFELLASTRKKVYVLFPGPGAVPLNPTLLSSVQDDARSEVPISSAEGPSKEGWILVAIDGTWREAREMWQSLKTKLLPPNGHCIQVILPQAPVMTQVGDEDDSSLPAKGACLIRKEPVEGFLTTYEAICKAVAVLEGTQPNLEDILLKPLRKMTEFQAAFDPAVAARCPWAVGDASEVKEAMPPIPPEERKRGLKSKRTEEVL
jgi:hypothetical protein